MPKQKPDKKQELSLACGIDADLVRGQCQYCLWHETCHEGSQWEPGVLVK